MNVSKKRFLIAVVLIIIIVLTSFIKIGGEIKNRYSLSLLLYSCNRSDLEKIDKFIFLKKLNIQQLESDELNLINKNNLKELVIMTTTNREAYKNMNNYNNLKLFYSVGLDFNDFSYFSSMKKLERLYLGLGYTDNRILSADAFEKLPVSIRNLCINGLENTEKLDFSNLKNLKTMHLDYSSLLEIEINNPNLENVLLFDNKSLEKLSISENSQKLKSLCINNSPNIKINISELERLKSLESISVTNGLLTSAEIDKLESLGIKVNIES